MTKCPDRRIVHLDMDAFFVSVERAHDPSLCGRPVIVGGRPGGRGVVAAASYEAREYGIESAMSIAEAERRCPHAVFVSGSFERYQEASASVDTIVRRWSPVVEWVSIDEAYLDLTATSRAIGHPRATAERIREEIHRELRLDASCGVATAKVVAKVASRLAKPRGLLYVLPGYEARFLAPLDIKLLPGVGPHTESRLRLIGVATLGQLAALSHDVLQSQLGHSGAVLARHAAGVDDGAVLPDWAPRSVSNETTLAADTRDRGHLRAILQRLAERAAHRLRGEGLLARTVTVKIRYDDFNTITRSATLRELSSVDADLVPLARKLLDGVLRATARRVRLIGISYSGLVPEGRQLSLFPRRDESRLARLTTSIDRIRERFGFDALMSATAREAEGPDRPQARTRARS